MSTLSPRKSAAKSVIFQDVSPKSIILQYSWMSGVLYESQLYPRRFILITLVLHSWMIFQRYIPASQNILYKCWMRERRRDELISIYIHPISLVFHTWDAILAVQTVKTKHPLHSWMRKREETNEALFIYIHPNYLSASYLG